MTLGGVVAAAIVGFAQQTSFDRLPRDVFDVVPPSERVSGAPGEMTIGQTTCRTLPMAQIRRRIVELAAQEWGFFGFTVMDQTRTSPAGQGARRTRRHNAPSPPLPP